MVVRKRGKKGRFKQAAELVASGGAVVTSGNSCNEAFTTRVFHTPSPSVPLSARTDKTKDKLSPEIPGPAPSPSSIHRRAFCSFDRCAVSDLSDKNK